MTLYVSPESAWWVRGAAALVLYLHIGGAGIGLLSGATALLVEKGQRLHRLAGNVFFASMLTMSAIGACAAPFLPHPQWSSTAMGVFVFYLIGTAWMTVRRKEGSAGRFEIGAFLVALSVATAVLTMGLQAARGAARQPAQPPPPFYFILAALVAFAAAMDLRMILRDGLYGAQRIARHLWRMCVALLIATFSFFLGQQQVFPASLRGSPILYVPEIMVLGSLIYWLVRVRFPKRSQRDAADEVSAFSVVESQRGSNVP
jgi:uncharacterized membrane protein